MDASLVGRLLAEALGFASANPIKLMRYRKAGIGARAESQPQLDETQAG